MIENEEESKRNGFFIEKLTAIFENNYIPNSIYCKKDSIDELYEKYSINK